MSWNFTVTGAANKTETLKLFDDAVDGDMNCEPKEALKDAARLLCEHMDDSGVSSIYTHGHTNTSGKGCSIELSINL